MSHVLFPLFFFSFSAPKNLNNWVFAHTQYQHMCNIFWARDAETEMKCELWRQYFYLFLLYLLVFSMSRNSVSFWYAFGNLKCFVYISMHGIFGNNTFLLRRRIMLAQTHIFFFHCRYFLLFKRVCMRAFLSNANFFTCLEFLYSIELFAKNFKE